MRAWLLDDFVGLDGLRLADVPRPQAGPGEVVLRVRYAALNPADRYLAERQYPAKPKLPHILGRDGMGAVVQVGPGVTGIAVGDRRALLRGDVGGNRPGTFAEMVAVPAEHLVELPDMWTEEQCAGASLVYLTAYQALTMWGLVERESVVLVTGASGGVGVAAVQLATAMGLKVLGLSRSAEKSARLLQLGAAATFNPEDPSWRKSVKEAIAPRRVSLVVDNVGGQLLPQAIDTLGELGKVSLVGRLAGPVPMFNTASLFFRRIRLGGVAVGAYTAGEGRAAWKEVLRLLHGTGARPVIDSVFAFEDLKKAFERLEQGPMGKVLLRL